MNRVPSIDLENALITVEPGVTNSQVTELVRSAGFFYAPDPSSQIVCTIGGNLAENAGGAHCLKYGFTTTHVLGCEVVLPSGELVWLGSPHGVPDTPGYDLMGVFIGSEGTLGVATKAVLRIVRRPQCVQTLLAAFNSSSAAGQTVSDIIAAGMLPSAMEMMDRTSIFAAEAAVHAGYPDCECLLLVELDGPIDEVNTQMQRVRELCTKNGAWEQRLAQSDAERALVWKGRKAAFAAMGRVSPNYIVQDGVIPRTALPPYLRAWQRMSAETGLRIANVFHAGDGNLHPMVLYDGSHARRRRTRARSLLQNPSALRRRRRLHHRRTRRRPREAMRHELHVRRARPRHHAPRSPRVRSPQHREPRKTLPHTPPLWRALPRLLRPASHRSLRPRGGLLMLAELNIETHQHDGITVLSPANTDEVAAILRTANGESLAVEPTGGRTKLTWGSRVTPRVQLSTTRLTGIREHVWQDMTATVAAGTPWSDMQRELARHNQRVALDPVFPDRATVGGVIATNDSGVLRRRYGSLRDLVLGMTIVLADGTIARSGGKVVKNVAGYDLPKLLTGSFGTLGVITEVTFRLHPLAASTLNLTTRSSIHHATRRLHASHHCRSAQPRSDAVPQRGGRLRPRHPARIRTQRSSQSGAATPHPRERLHTRSSRRGCLVRARTSLR